MFLACGLKNKIVSHTPKVPTKPKIEESGISLLKIFIFKGALKGRLASG